ncbi:hypothetical protein E2C01_098460 [Portunus trituberculatus]|uniref:Uncharacterized protein n=1 Tax=Portunus trituberculatus TaxID=210409 RepID=A0A5B7K8B5_PORTR|nr:hypothetical protein [Portunus trituberculatus]
MYVTNTGCKLTFQHRQVKLSGTRKHRCCCQLREYFVIAAYETLMTGKNKEKEHREEGWTPYTCLYEDSK